MLYNPTKKMVTVVTFGEGFVVKKITVEDWLQLYILAPPIIERQG
jgi:hypothetical protein